MTPDRLAEIKARLEAATAGAWTFMDSRTGFYGEIRTESWQLLASVEDVNLDADGELIANAPADLHDLITALKAAQERIVQLETQVQRVRSDHQYIIGYNDGWNDGWNDDAAAYLDALQPNRD